MPKQNKKNHAPSVTYYFSLFVWLVADGWCWFILREKYCWHFETAGVVMIFSKYLSKAKMTSVDTQNWHVSVGQSNRYAIPG
jgi:hypothetical protein